MPGPIRRGGLGLPLASDIQAPAYMSSLTQAIYSKVLPEECSSYRDFMEAFHRVLNSPLSPLDSWLATDRILIDRAHVKFWCKQSWWADILAGKRFKELKLVQSRVHRVFHRTIELLFCKLQYNFAK